MRSIATLALLFLLSCSGSKEKIDSENPESVKTPYTSKDVETSKNDFEELTKCQIQFYLIHDSVSNEAKEFWIDKRKPSDDNATSNVLLELNTKPIEVVPFYFIVANKIMGKTDGALTELTLEAAYEFVFVKHTNEFFSYSNLEHCIIDRQNFSYSNWAQQLGNALSMNCDAAEDYNNCIVTKFSELKVKCPNCNVEELKRRVKGWL